MSNWLPLIGAAILAYLLGVYFFGFATLGGITVNAIVFIVAVLSLLKWRGVSWAKAWFFDRKTNMYLGLGLTAWLVFSLGIFGLPAIIPFSPESIFGGFTAASFISAPSAVTQAACSVSPEILGKDASITLNAWDLEANDPYSSAVDFSTSCYVYKNGNSAANFVATTTDTSAGTLNSGFTVGDVMNIYCGGSSYYGEPVENECIDSQDDMVNINAHAIAGETDLAITVYDDTGSAALTAAGNSTTADYDLTLGANEEKSIYVQLKVNAANKAYNFIGFATGAGNDIKSVVPVDSKFVKRATVDFLDDVSVNGGSATNQTITYTAYTLNAPVLLSEWEQVKHQFTVTAGTSDPSATDNVFSTIDAAIVCGLDATYARGSDGVVYLDYYVHSTGSETNVGVSETFTDPVGKNSCVVIEGN